MLCLKSLVSRLSSNEGSGFEYQVGSWGGVTTQNNSCICQNLVLHILCFTWSRMFLTHWLKFFLSNQLFPLIDQLYNFKWTGMLYFNLWRAPSTVSQLWPVTWTCCSHADEGPLWLKQSLLLWPSPLPVTLDWKFPGVFFTIACKPLQATTTTWMTND